MKVIWFAHRDIQNPRAGGAERTIHEVSQRLQTFGIDVTLVSCLFPGSPSDVVVDGVQIHRVGGPITSHIKVRSLIRSRRPDAIVDDLGHVVPWFSEWMGKAPGTVFFHHLHARTLSGQLSPPLALLFKQLETIYPRIYRRWPFVTEGAQSAADLLHLGIPRDRIVRIPPGVDLQRFRPSEKFPEPTIIYFGGFRDYKRAWVPVSIYWLLESRIQGLRLLMVGDGPSRRGVEANAYRNGRGRIEFLGRVDDSYLAWAVSRSWVNVHASVSEGWGLSILEAAAAGTPSVAFAVPGVLEAIDPGVSGITVPEGEIDHLAAVTYQILCSCNEWVARSRRFAEQFTWQSSAEAWASHLKKVANGAWPGYSRQRTVTTDSLP
jgi:glycosyltransferase involved in cell wall biosynthesis